MNKAWVTFQLHSPAENVFSRVVLILAKITGGLSCCRQICNVLDRIYCGL